MEINRIVEAKNHGGLDDWFKKEKWVDVSRPKKKGKGYEPCGRGDTSKGKNLYVLLQTKRKILLKNSVKTEYVKKEEKKKIQILTKNQT